MQSSNSIKDWRELEAKVLDLFVSLGYKAEKGARITGVRAEHQVDVIASFEYGGLRYQVVVECKYWNKKVNKAQVAALSSIVSDLGAEKGVIISKVGFQNAAVKLAENSNIDLYTFEQLAKKAEETIEKALRHRCFDLIISLAAPFYEFHAKMSRKAEQMKTFWFPTEKGLNFLGSIALFEDKLKRIDNKRFPCYYMEVPPLQEKPLPSEPKRTEVNSKLEYLRLLLRNLVEFKQSAESFRDEIFSE